MSPIARLLPHRGKSARLLLFLCCVFPLALRVAPVFAVSCQPSTAESFPDTRLPDANAALAKGDAAAAVPVYQKALLADPTSPVLNAALAEAYLDEGKAADADATLSKAGEAHPHSAILETVVAEAQLREGRPWDAEDTVTRALADDPCYPDAHLVQGRLLTYVSMRASAAKQYSLAHQLAPRDADAFSFYLDTLTIPQRIAAANQLLAKATLDPASQKKWQHYVSRLQAEASAPQGACTLLPSGAAATEIELVPLAMQSPGYVPSVTQAVGGSWHVRAAGLDVKIEQHPTHLEIDTGASGLVLSAGAAGRAGLQYVDDFAVNGIGGEGAGKAHHAYAKSIKLGSLEFRDCPVTIFENRFSDNRASPLNDVDGLIGMDTLRNFLVTLDYPHGKLRLTPLPTPPTATAEAVSLNTGADSPSVNNSAQDAAPNSLWQDRYIAPEMKDYSSVYHFGHFLAVPASLSSGSGAPASIAKDKIRLFILDTGAYRTLVTTTAGQEVGKLHHDQMDRIYGLAGKVQDLYYVDQITFNFARVSVVTNEVPATDAASMAAAHNPMQISGFIGASALRQCVVHLDYRDGLVKLDYTPGPSRF